MKGIEFDWMKIIGIVIGAMVVLGIVTYYGLTGEKTYMDYVYSTATNGTDSGWINTSLNGTQSLVIGDIASISGETPVKNLTVKAENIDTTAREFTVYLNDVSIGTLNALNQTNTTKTFTDVGFTANSVNTLKYGNTVNVGSDLRVLNATGIYPSSKEDIGSSPTTNILINVALIISILVFVTATIVSKLGFK